MNMQTATVMAPPQPSTLETMNLPLIMMRDIVLKTLFRKNLNTTRALAQALCLPATVTQELIDIARSQTLIEATGSMGINNTTGEMGYQLTENGKARAMDALAQSEYFGAMPVPLCDYAAQVKRQSIRNIQVTREQLVNSMGHLVLPDDLLSNLGPAVSAGRSILMYGPPGNGKSSISNGIRSALGDKVYIPRAIEYSGQVITVYDPIVHSAAEGDGDQAGQLRRKSRFDSRYVLCERPTVVTGGELSLSMLDLVYNPTARTYQAPLQLKSTGGIFIVDDLGHQQEPPQSLVNRWIVPLEEGRDILALQSGEKFEVPFDTLVIFSTNFHPNEIFDQAALRQIFFKIKIDGPNQENFLKIFAMVARKKKMQLDEASLVHLLKSKYATINNVYANYQPVFLIDQMIAICDFEGLPYRMTPELVDRAWGNLFVKDEMIVK
ncbi:MAG: ATPase [Roseivivax sp.]|nr:ATPase [Roseivivax sp.]